MRRCAEGAGRADECSSYRRAVRRAIKHCGDAVEKQSRGSRVRRRSVASTPRERARDYPIAKWWSPHHPEPGIPRCLSRSRDRTRRRSVLWKGRLIVSAPSELMGRAAILWNTATSETTLLFRDNNEGFRVHSLAANVFESPSVTCNASREAPHAVAPR